MVFDFFKEASEILAESDSSVTLKDVRLVLEDTTSPVTNKYIENLYKQVVSKSHINFGDIPTSRGNIKKYSGYKSMMETLQTMRKLVSVESNADAVRAVDTVLAAIGNIESLEDIFEKGFSTRNDHVMLEYNVFVYSCVEATTCILSEFVEFIKEINGTYQIKIKNTKYKAGLFFIEQLEKFNAINAAGNYRNYLTTMLDKNKDNFVGATAVGVTAVVLTVLIAIVPVTRALIYQIYRLRMKLSDALELQAYFLELNRTCVEANSSFDSAKKAKILKKQEAVRSLFIKLSDKIKVDVARATRDSSIDKKKDNSVLSLGDTRAQVDSSPYDFLL